MNTTNIPDSDPLATMPLHHTQTCLEQILRQICNVSQEIQCTSGLDTALSAATVAARELLGSDRLIIYHFLPSGDGVVLAESVGQQWQPIDGQLIYDPCFKMKWHLPYQQGRTSAIVDRETADLAPCYQSLLARLQVRANLVVPILLQLVDTSQLPELWGLLIAHQCGSSRQWQPIDVEVLRYIAMQVGCKIQSLNSHRTVSHDELPHPQSGQTSHGSKANSGTTNPIGNQPSNPIDSDCGEVVSLQAFDYLQNPVWVYDIERSQMHWANRASLHLWNASSRDELLSRDFGDASESTRIRLQNYLQQFEQGKTIVEQWTFYPEGQPVSVQCRCSGIPIERGRLAMLVEGSVDTAHQITLEGICWHGVDARRSNDPVTGESTILVNEKDIADQVQGIIGNSIDMTELKQAEINLRYQTERERMIATISQHIRESLDLDSILNTTVSEVRRFLQCDRVIIYRFNPDWSGVVMTESVAPGWNSILNMEIRDTYFVENREKAYVHRAIQARDNIYTAGLSQCHIDLLERLQVKAKLVVPIWQGDTLWGLLVAHQCQAPHHWQSLERDLLLQLATQVAIAIQQSELYHQVQHWNTHLERQVQERTAQLRQALDFEALLKRITDKVRDSLDEQEILRSAVQELALGLKTICCAGIYNADQTTSTIAYEFSHHLSLAKGKTFAISHSPHTEVYQFLLQGQVCQFCDVAPNPLRSDQQLLAILACPIMDDQGVLGDLWLFKPSDAEFNDQEVRLVQQVANQCAIALRQSRLYCAAQAQVEELARLNQLKDDFLSTISHELRTPLSSMKTAIQMLEICLRPLGVFEPETNPINRYFQILQTEYQQEIGLINDLLDLTRIDSGSDPLNLCPIHLQYWIAHVLEPFAERTYHQEQNLEVVIPEDLPPLTTDLAYLERVLTELLHNAFKYTPSGETIAVSARLSSNQNKDFIWIEVSNTGVEIPEVERDRIFDKFYRIPNNDPWKHGGTGLGLSLVKKIIQRLGGAIWVESRHSLTQFIMQFPLNQIPPEIN